MFFGTFFSYLRCENISEGLLKFCKLVSNLIIDSNLTSYINVPHKLLDFMKLDITKTNIKYNNYSV